LIELLMGNSCKMNGLILPMKVRFNSLVLFATLAALPLSAHAQSRPGPAAPPVVGKPVAAPPAAAQNPAAPSPATGPQQPVEPPPPPPLPPALWDQRNAVDLLSYIQQVGSEGLNPADYDPDGLMAAMASGDPLRMSAEATDRFNRVSSDLALGHVKLSQRIDWHVKDPDLDAAGQDATLRAALAQHNIAGALRNLLPTHPQYAALKAALDNSGDRHGQAQPHPAQHGPLALVAARPRFEICDRQCPRLPRDPGREWRQPVETAGDRRQAVDPDPAAQRHGGRSNPQPVVGSAQEHRP